MGEKKRRMQADTAAGRALGAALSRIRGSLAADVYSRYIKNPDPDIAGMARMIAEAGRLDLDPEVATGWAKIDAPWGTNTTDWSHWASGILPMAQLPFPTTWLEWALPDAGSDRVGALIYPMPGFQGLGPGLLIWGAGRYGPFHAAKPGDSTAGLYPAGLLVVPEGTLLFGVDGNIHPDDLEREYPESVEIVVALGVKVLRLLAFLGTRNAPIEIGEPEAEPIVHLWKRDARRPLTCRPVRWSLSRLERRSGRTLTDGERAEVQAHLCRGHPKRRKSGVFWWAPHWRGTGPRPAGGRDHVVTP